jgi:cell division protease FtsH
MAQLIDKEVQDLVNSCYNRTKDLLIEHRSELEALAQLLLKKEIVEKEDLEKIMGKRVVAELEGDE